MSRLLFILCLLRVLAQEHPAPPVDFRWVNALPKGAPRACLGRRIILRFTTPVWATPSIFRRRTTLAPRDSLWSIVSTAAGRAVNTYDLARRYAARREHKPTPMIAVGTENQNYHPNLHWMAFLDWLSIAYEKVVVPGVKHDARGVYQFLRAKSMAFHAACVASRPNVAK
ncbi:MAG: hypothetical protein ACKV2U_09415 [Bryobacteraceae bacterium]